MFIIDVKSGENIDCVLKCYKWKYCKVGVLQEIRKCKYFIKFLVEWWKEVFKVVYILKK